MDTSKLSRGELVAVAGGLLLLVGVFLKWYASVSVNATIAGHEGVGSYSGWQVHTIIRYLLVLAAIAPVVLAYIILRDHQLSWPRGEMTAVIAIVVIGLTVYNGVIDRPGDPSGEIELRPGWYLAFVGAVLMLTGSVMRQQQSEVARKPPGVM